MGVGTLISVDEYLRTSFHPDCDFIEGEVLERNAGKRRHGYAQTEIAAWFVSRRKALRLQPITELRMRIGPNKIRISDEEVFTSPPYLCVEVTSPADTMASLQDCLDDQLHFGVPNLWVVDPWKHRGWRVTADGWATAADGVMRTVDGRIGMPLVDVLLP